MSEKNFRKGDILRIARDKCEGFRGIDDEWDRTTFVFKRYVHKYNTDYVEVKVIHHDETKPMHNTTQEWEEHWFEVLKRGQPTFTVVPDFETSNVDEAIAFGEKISKACNMNVKVLSH